MSTRCAFLGPCFTTIHSKYGGLRCSRFCINQVEVTSCKTKRFAKSRVKTNACLHESPTKSGTTETRIDEIKQYETKEFDWMEQWYPVALEADIENSLPAPIPFSIFGERFVLWKTRDRARKWSIFRDYCPHRFAALSEGRIDPTTGNLQCGYHGWQFDAKGACKKIPQATNESVADSPQACAKRLHCCTEAGIVFVWLGTQNPPQDKRPAVLQDVQTTHVKSSITRDLPFSFMTLLQNVLDPAHIHFAHHGQIGHRSKAGPVAIRVFTKHSNMTQDEQSPSDIAFAADYYNGRVTVRFRPPCLVEIVTAAGEAYAYYSVPIDSYRARTIGIQVRSARSRFIPTVPRWLDHLRRNMLVDADLILMHGQEQELARKAQSSAYLDDVTAGWNFYMPTTSDRLIIELRKWVQHNPPPRTTKLERILIQRSSARSELLDRYESHCVNCNSCQQALRNVKLLIIAMKLLSSISLICVAFFGIGLHSPQIFPVMQSMSSTKKFLNILRLTESANFIVWLGCLSLLARVTVAGLRRLERSFFYVETARRQTRSP